MQGDGADQRDECGRPSNIGGLAAAIGVYTGSLEKPGALLSSRLSGGFTWALVLVDECLACAVRLCDRARLVPTEATSVREGSGHWGLSRLTSILTLSGT
jgi:hypothetical protein